MRVARPGAEVRARALVLSRSVLPNGSKRMELLSDSAGRIYAVATAAGKISRWSGLFEPLTLLEVILMAAPEGSEGASGTYRVISADFVTDFPGLKKDVQTLRKAAPFVRLMQGVLPVHQPTPECFRLLVECLAILHRCARTEDLYLLFNYRTLEALGGAPPHAALLRATAAGVCRGRPAISAGPAFRRQLRAAWDASIGVELSPGLVPVRPRFQPPEGASTP